MAEDILLKASQIEKVSVVVYRYDDDPLGAFLSFDGASRESVIERITAVAVAKTAGSNSADKGVALLPAST